jgi:tetratricopeptide (TPR) repeat protein
MSVKVANSRFIVPSLAGFCQHLTSSVSSFQELGNRVAHEAEVAQAFRHIERLEELGSILSNFPLKEYRLMGQYYLGWSAYRKGENVQETFEQIVEQSKTYKATALIDLANIDFDKGDFVSALKNCIEATKRADSLSTALKAVRSVAILKSLEGSHQRALKDLERIYPLIKYASPIVRYQYLNSYAVELGEVGRIEEAQKVSQITLASPYAFAYPEWRETEQDLALRGYKSRSSVRVKTIPGNLLYLPEREASDIPVIQDEDARLFDLEEWKEKKMVKEPNGDDETNPDKMTEQDMVMKLIQMLTTGEGDEKKIRELLKFALKTFYGK